MALGGLRPAAPDEGPIDGLDLWAYDGSTGQLRRIESSPNKGYGETDSINTGIPPSNDTTIAVAGEGTIVVAAAASPWRFFVVDDLATDELAVAGRWEQLLGLMPHADGARAIGILSGGLRAPVLGYADLVRDETAVVHLLSELPVRDGMWLGYGRDRRGSAVLIGGGTDEYGQPHSDVYAVDLSHGGGSRLIATDDGTPIGPDAWVTGERRDQGWYLRAVPARTGDDNVVRHGAYERLTAFEDSWRPAGLSAIDAPRADITTTDRIRLGSSCELAGAPWVAPPGQLVFGEKLTGPVLVCDQPIPEPPVEHKLPRQVQAYALQADTLWTLSDSGLERWDLGASWPPGPVEQLASLAVSPGKGKSHPAVALSASDTLVAASLDPTLTIVRRGARGWQVAGSVDLCDEVVAVHAGHDEVWAVGERHVSHLRVTAEGLHLLSVFELLLDGETDDLFARRLDGTACDGPLAPAAAVGAAVDGRVMVIAFPRRIVTLALERPDWLPTIGSITLARTVRQVTTDGGFVYAHTPGRTALARLAGRAWQRLHGGGPRAGAGVCQGLAARRRPRCPPHGRGAPRGDRSRAVSGTNTLARWLGAAVLVAATPAAGCSPDAPAGAGGADGGSCTSTSAPDGSGASDAATPVAGACGPIGPWGDWPPPGLPRRKLERLDPAFPRPDCGPGCRLVTTRYNTANGRAWEMRFSGRWLTHAPVWGTAIVVNLDTLDEYEVPVPKPEPGTTSYSAALSGPCLVQAFHHEQGDARRGYVCETCLHVPGTRGLFFSEGVPGNPGWAGLITADEDFVLLGGGRDEHDLPLGFWALDLRDGSRHTFATSSYLVANVSLNQPYIVLSEDDGEVHLIDTRDWSDTNVSNDPSLQWYAAGDDKTVVWIDQRFHPGGDLEHPANQEVVAYDIATQQMKRLTFTNDSQPSAKWDPAVEDEWVVWQDDRDSDAPNSTPTTPKDRVDVYGYNLETNQEYHVLGNVAGSLTEQDHGPHGLLASSLRLHQGKLYVMGLYMVGNNPMNQVWEFELPEP